MEAKSIVKLDSRSSVIEVPDVINEEDGLNFQVHGGRVHGPVRPTRPTTYYGMAGTLAGILITNAISVSSFFIGIIYLGKENCPAEPLLQPLLVLGGMLGLLISAMEGCCWGRAKIEWEDEKPCCLCRVMTVVVSICKTGAFLYFTVLVIHLWSRAELQRPPKHGDAYCNPTLFYFSLTQIMIVVTFILLYFFFHCLTPLCCKNRK